jgi:long-subunit fatty acid transport protein
MEYMQWTKRYRHYVIVMIVGMWGVAPHVDASQLVFPGVGMEDGSLGGNVVALPLNPISALFHNPAQLTLLPHSLSVSGVAARYHPSYANPQGYDNTSRELPMLPSLGYVTHRFAPLSVGIGAYGALGFVYNFDADPQRGVPNNLYTELAVLSLAPAVAYSISPNLHLGFGINPSYGRLRFKSPSPVGRIDVDVRGAGVFGSFGVLYTPTPKLTLGLGYKTPGMVWMRGNARVAGQGDDAAIDLHLPQGIEFGGAYRVTDWLTLVAQGRWTHLSIFEDSILEFDERSELNGPAARDVRDRFRLGGGIQWRILRRLTLHLGFSWERWAIKASSLSPAFPDVTDYQYGGGLTFHTDRWKMTVGVGNTYNDRRHVSAAQNPAFPGSYRLDMSVFGVQFTRLLVGTVRV